VLGLDPRYAVGRATAALGWMMQGRQKEAVAMLTGMTEAMPGFLTPWIYLGIEQLNMERWQEAETSFRRTLTLAPENPTFVSLLAQAQAGQHRRKEAAASFGKLMALKATRYVSPTASALAAMAAGETEGALLAVEGVVTERDANFSLFRKMRAFDPIRQRPEFLATLAAMGLRNA
jgi:Flp pilus assembly protein TadD